MRLAMLYVMMVSLLRDRGALALTFLLPGLVFAIFAVIFAGASGGDLEVRIAIHDGRGDAASGRLVAKVLEDHRLTRLGGAGSEAEVVRLVRAGDADVGLVLQPTGAGLDRLAAGSRPPVIVVADPAREIATAIVRGILLEAYIAAVPEAPMRAAVEAIDSRIVALTPEQRARVDAGLKQLGRQEATADTSEGFSLERLTERREATSASRAAPAVTYYAGAVAMMFLLFSALAGAISLIDERESGLLDRLAIGPGGIGVVLDGKLMFLWLQGIVQALIVFAVAWAGFGVDVPSHLGGWAMTTLLAAAAAAGLALAFVSLTRSRAQAQTLGQMLVLIVSAIGGSMVPRYLMPSGVQALGWGTPNTWAIEAYTGLLHRGESAMEIWPCWAVLAMLAAAGHGVAHLAARRSV